MSDLLTQSVYLSPAELAEFDQISADFNNPETGAILADDLPELAFARGAAAAEALGILAMRESGELEQMPEVDAIGTGRLYYQTVAEYGEHSVEAKQALELVAEDCRTMLFEGLYAWDFVSKTVKKYNPEDGQFYVGNRAARQLFKNGLSTLLPDWEQSRRGAETVEEATHEAMVPSGLYKSYDALTISMFARKPDAEKLGYRKENQKMMIRYTEYVEKDGQVLRIDYQASCDGPTLATVKGFFAKLGLDASLVEDETGVLRMQTLLPKLSLPKTLEMLDQIQGGGSFMLRRGENPDQKRYQSIVETSQSREAEAKHHVTELTKYVLSLSKRNADPVQARAFLKDKLTQTVHEICRRDPVKALHAFDNKTYQRYAAAQGARLRGNHELAQELEQQAFQEAPPVGACGTGGVAGELASHIGGLAREAEPHENAKFGGTVYEGGQCLHCLTSPTMVGEWGYCGPCADQVCGEEPQTPQTEEIEDPYLNEIIEQMLGLTKVDDTQDVLINNSIKAAEKSIFASVT